MNPLERGESYIPMSRKEFRKQCIALGASKKEADSMYREASKQETWVNDLYVVNIDRDANHGFGTLPGGMFEISIRRVDREPIMDWRHLQQIKNQIIGKENEMVQLFPAESRLRDAANQYWFYGFNNPEVRFPFGMFGRVVDATGDQKLGKSKQRPTQESKS